MKQATQANTVLLFLQGGDVGVMKRLKRYKTSLTTLAQHQCKLPDPRPRAVQQPAMMGAVLETTARLTQAATVM